MTAYLLSYGVPWLLAIVAGGIGGGLTALKLRRPETVEPVANEPKSDPFIDAEIDLASVRWAEANNQPPDAAGLMAERLKTLHKIGKRKGWV
ncbi:MAG: hypothetical protein AB7V58_06370 [Solirubrobacterales bacterium]